MSRSTFPAALVCTLLLSAPTFGTAAQPAAILQTAQTQTETTPETATVAASQVKTQNSPPAAVEAAERPERKEQAEGTEQVKQTGQTTDSEQAEPSTSPATPNTPEQTGLPEQPEKPEKPKQSEDSIQAPIPQPEPVCTADSVDSARMQNAIESLGTERNMALHQCAAAGQTQAVRAIVFSGASTAYIAPDGTTPLMVSVGRPETLSALLETGADPDAGNADGLTALHIAAARGDKESMTLLLSAGAAPDVQTDNPVTSAEGFSAILPENSPAARSAGLTPLMLACASGNTDTIRLLLSKNASPDILSDTRKTAADYLQYNRNLSPAYKRALGGAIRLASANLMHDLQPYIMTLREQPKEAAFAMKVEDTPLSRAYLAYLHAAHLLGLESSEDSAEALLEGIRESIKPWSWTDPLGVVYGGWAEVTHHPDGTPRSLVDTSLFTIAYLTLLDSEGPDGSFVQPPYLLPEWLFRQHGEAAYGASRLTSADPERSMLFFAATPDSGYNVTTLESVQQYTTLLEQLADAMNLHPTRNTIAKAEYKRLVHMADNNPALLLDHHITPGKLEGYLTSLTVSDVWKRHLLDSMRSRRVEAISEAGEFFSEHFGLSNENAVQAADNLLRLALIKRLDLECRLWSAPAQDNAIESIRQARTLRTSALDGHLDTVTRLVEEGYDCNALNDLDEQTPLMAAVDHPEIVAYLLEKGASVNAHTGSGQTAAHLAARLGNAESLKLLLEAGADASLRDGQGVTPLMYAAAAGSADAASLLVNNGANTTAEDNNGKTARDWLDHAVDLSVTDFETLLLLLSDSL